MNCFVEFIYYRCALFLRCFVEKQFSHLQTLVGETGGLYHHHFNQLEMSNRGEITMIHDHHPTDVTVDVVRL